MKDGRAGLTLACSAAALFGAWKHSVVREDVHARVLVLFGLLIVTVLITDSVTAERRWRAAPLLAGAVASLIGAWSQIPTGDGPWVQSLTGALAKPLHLPGVGGLQALVGLGQYRARLAELSRRALEPRVLPAENESF